MRGKNKCKILKEIRQKIADENDIPYVTKECTYQGECSGTCPKCEAELRYLEQQLEKRRSLGKRVTVAALAASLMTGLVGCPASEPLPKVSELAGDVPYVASTEPTTVSCENSPSEKPGIIEPQSEAGVLPETEQTEVFTLEGMIPADTEETVELIGEVAYDPASDNETETDVLEGDVAYLPENTVEYFTEENHG